MSQELHEAFKMFAVYGDTSASGKDMTGKNFSKLCKECKIMDGKAITSTDIDIVFNKVKTKGARNITFEEFVESLKELAAKRFKGQAPAEALESMSKLVIGKSPSSTGITKAVAVGAVDRLTDTSKYTGSHKERFDESGKGKGISGREEMASNTGYVGAYKGAGTYDGKTKK
uniref:Tubulin polymerization-promoting protein family member 3 n=1 Tax=Geotrypetes seraphini TaxID=260995 RepID=A0A6P8PDW4_GEOSA|nr:tubulin polymerization-promoting protein family member 3-like [Geotrypetes seraphini]XP_033779331.1 tubulin polymerization-promoting protein family member 3-like [Geotrypetes seraphini]XP_033779332.1 tubulin polymerization-promoting protein family member 3-like [Geotrypetes seraphini]XP_033779333.1 tubulin polymerization-promoting protein family member 3-like [Geotrypetes seraphini]